jgi:hypothetical protein
MTETQQNILAKQLIVVVLKMKCYVEKMVLLVKYFIWIIISGKRKKEFHINYVLYYYN